MASTVIAGKPSNTVGEKDSTLILRGSSVKILWGNKFIDLVKNGKINTEKTEFFKSVESEELIDNDGIYKIGEDIWISIGGSKIKLNADDLYISFLEELLLSPDLKDIALKNIGFYYDNLTDVQNISSGIVYIKNENTLYLIKDGIATKFQSESSELLNDKIEELFVGNIHLYKDIILGNPRLLFDVNNIPYILLENNQILLKKDIIFDGFIKSYNADDNNGFNLTMDNGEATLKIDHLIIKDSLRYENIKSLTVFELRELIRKKELVKERLYRITDFRNVWEMEIEEVLSDTVDKEKNVRSIIVKAKTENTLYEECFYEDHPEWLLHYDINYAVEIEVETKEGPKMVLALGMITYLKDENGNEANYDFKHLLFIHNQKWWYTFSNEDGEENSKAYTNNKIELFDVLMLSVNKDGLVGNFRKGEDYCIFTFPCHGNTLINFKNTLYIDQGNRSARTGYFNNNVLDNVIWEENKIYNIQYKIEGCTFKGEFSGNQIKTDLINSTFDGKVTNNSFGNEDSNYINESIFNGVVSNNDFLALIDNTTFKGKTENNILDSTSIITNSVFNISSTNTFNSARINNSILNNASDNNFSGNINNSNFLVSVSNNSFRNSIDSSNFSEISDSLLVSCSISFSDFLSVKTCQFNSGNIVSSKFLILENTYFTGGTILSSEFFLIRENTYFSEGIIENSIFTGAISESEFKGNIKNSTFQRAINKSVIGMTLINSIFNLINEVLLLNGVLLDCLFKYNISGEELDLFTKYTLELLNCECYSNVSGKFAEHSESLLNHLKSDEFKQISVFTNKDGLQQLKLLSDTINEIPLGTIVMWYGENIPVGWAICDGENGTPNLIGHFIKADTVAGATGGNNSITISADNLPDHTHDIPELNISESGEHAHDYYDEYTDWKSFGEGTYKMINSVYPIDGKTFADLSLEDTSHFITEGDYKRTTENSGKHTHTIEASRTSGVSNVKNAPINIEPKYFSLIFIMKL